MLCLNKKPHVVIITESWFNDKSICNIDNYTCYRSDRLDKNNGGGVCIYVRKDIISIGVHYAQLTKRESVEQIWCQICIGEEYILIGCIYRPSIVKKDGVVLDKLAHKTRDKEINNSLKFVKNLLKIKKFMV